ncbi:MAG: WYL domain-containing protein [Firmicutes bacterium HGW-Firmicutes-16]|nr:MAG: WYL domain-containing protein [Firmicutes bacterium HGW-Firmicutes-16]
MPKSPNQKLKLLYIMQFLLEKSDEQHPISVNEIIAHLETNAISAERKSIYSDIESLRVFGVDIIQQRGANGGYYVASRKFEIPELKLLVDSVQSSKFITEKKTITLIKKIESFASVHEAQLLHRQVYVKNRIKNMNESIYYNVDEIHTGIASDCKICFKYFEYSVSKERICKHNGAKYCISPFALTWDDENYYMIGFDSSAGIIKHFRVDKMMDISVFDEKRDGREQFENLDLAAYSKTHFGMFTGKEERVALEFSNSLAGAVIDRFGKDAALIPADAEHFRIHTDVAVSPQFFGWLCGFGSGVKILAPESVVREMKEHIASIEKHYSD